jgi:hypothetical protein
MYVGSLMWGSQSEEFLYTMLRLPTLILWPELTVSKIVTGSQPSHAMSNNGCLAVRRT